MLELKPMSTIQLYSSLGVIDLINKLCLEVFMNFMFSSMKMAIHVKM